MLPTNLSIINGQSAPFFTIILRHIGLSTSQLLITWLQLFGRVLGSLIGLRTEAATQNCLSRYWVQRTAGVFQDQRFAVRNPRTQLIN